MQLASLSRRYKNGKEIMADERFKMTRDDTFYILKIRHVERKDKGTYKCVVSTGGKEGGMKGRSEGCVRREGGGGERDVFVSCFDMEMMCL